jgi:hypothetical protein
MKLACKQLIFVAVLIGLAVAAHNGVAQAQDSEERRPRSLSDRLEQFRRDLLGSSDKSSTDKPATTQNNRRTTKPALSDDDRPISAAGRNASRATTAADSRTTNAPTPASRMVTKERNSSEATPRLAAQPDFVRNATTRQQTAVREEIQPEEVPPGQLHGTSARPARRGGAFEAAAPRVARSTRNDFAEAEESFDDDGDAQANQPVVVPAGSQPRSSGANVLFSSKNPVLALEATGPRKVLIGREAEFNVQLRNAGEVAATGVVVKINIPGFAEVAAAEPSAGKAIAPRYSEESGELEWQIDRLDARDRETLSLKLIPRKSIPLDLAMHWQCAPEMSQTIVEVQEPKLSLSISGPREVFYGQTKIYKLTLTNPGNGDAENVLINLLPIDQSQSAATYRVGTLKAGDSKAIDIELTARQAGKLQIKSQAVGDGGLRVDAVEEVTVRRADLKLAAAGAKVKYAGTPTIYRIRVANQGDAIAEDVELVAMLPPDADFLNATNNGKYDEGGRKVVWQIGAMQPGDDNVFDVTCTPNSPGDNILQALVHSADDLTASATATTQIEALADLKLEVRDPRGPVLVGADAKYELILRNRGTKAAENIDVVAFFSEGLEAVKVQGNEHQIGPGQVVIKTIPAILAGSEAVIHVTCRADRPGNLILRAEVNCRNPGTKLSTEETTHFYGGDELEISLEGEAEKPAESVEGVEGEAAEIDATPAGLAPSAASRYPTRR